MSDHEARYEDAARAVGFGDALDFLGHETPSDRLVRNILGAVALGLLESGFEPS